MSADAVLSWGVNLALVLLACAAVLAAWRIARGPRAQDRVLGLDAMYVAGMLSIVLFGVRQGQAIYFEAALVIGLLGFAATVALAKFLMRGEVIE